MLHRTPSVQHRVPLILCDVPHIDLQSEEDAPFHRQRPSAIWVLRPSPVPVTVIQMYRAAAFLAYGSTHFTRSAYLQAAKTYSPDDLAHSLEGKHVVITGANAGLGFSTAQALAAK